ncbi:hypothetical protein APHAL10511_008532 [Amanita phalloides]|nr:hypothetical protein APHAL10511_008532 [Amanita phalloides]
MTFVHIGVAADPTSALLERLRYIQVRTPKRQSSNSSIPITEFPVQCQKGCTPAVNALNTCSAATCLCNPTIDSSLGQCISCSVNAEPTASVIQNGQQVLDSYNTLCKGTGVSSLSLSITASQSGSSISSASGSVTASNPTGSPSQRTITSISSLSTPASAPAPSSPTSNSPSAAIGILPSFEFASIGLVVALLTSLLA